MARLATPRQQGFALALLVALLLLPAFDGHAFDGAQGTAAQTASGDTATERVDRIGPWQVGAAAIGGGQVDAIERHDEFVRIAFTHQGPDGRRKIERLEIVAQPVVGDPFSTRRHRIQPLPGESPDEDFVLAQANVLRAWEDKNAGETVVAGRRSNSADGQHRGAQPATGPPGAAQSAAATNLPRHAGGHHVTRWNVASPWLLAWLLLPLLSLLLIAVYARQRPDRRVALGIASAWSVGVPAIAALLLWSVELPTDAITSLHEGTTEFGIHRLYGDWIHAGPAHQAIVSILQPNGGVVLPTLVKLHVVVGIANVALFVAMLLQLQRSRWLALLLVCELVTNDSLIYATLSEVPSTLCHFALLHGTIAWLLTVDRTISRRLRVAAWVQVALATATVTATRTELGIFGLAAMASAFWETTAAGTPREAWFAEAQRWVHELLTLRRPITLAIILVSWSALSMVIEHNLVYALLMPLPGDVYSMILYLFHHFSVGTCVLIALGAAGLWRDGIRSAWVLISAFLLFRVSWIYGHQGDARWELLRYGSYWIPQLLWIAAAGGAVLRRSRFYTQLTKPARVVLGMLAAGALFGHANDNDQASLATLGGLIRHPTASGVLALDSQLETRLWLRQIEQTPDCVIVARVAASLERIEQDGNAATMPSAWVAFSGGLAKPIRLPDAENLDQAIDAALPDAKCVLLGRGVDCALVPSIGCVERETAPLQRIDASGRPWTHAGHAPLRGPVTLGVWPFRGPGTSATAAERGNPGAATAAEGVP